MGGKLIRLVGVKCKTKSDHIRMRTVREEIERIEDERESETESERQRRREGESTHTQSTFRKVFS